MLYYRSALVRCWTNNLGDTDTNGDGVTRDGQILFQVLCSVCTIGLNVEQDRANPKSDASVGLTKGTTVCGATDGTLDSEESEFCMDSYRYDNKAEGDLGVLYVEAKCGQVSSERKQRILEDMHMICRLG